MPATSLDLSQIKTDAISSAATFRSLIGLGTLATQSATITDYLTIASAASSYQPLDSDLTAIAALSTTAFGRALLTESSNSTARSTLGLGTLSTVTPTGTPDGTKFLRDDNSWQVVNLSAYLPLAGGTMTGALAIAQATANTSVLTSTGYSLTGSNAQSLVDLAGTWNTSGTPTLIKANVTDTASASGSLLMDLQVGGSSKFQITKSNRILIGVTSSFANLHFKAASGAASIALEPAANNVSGIYFGGNSGDFSNSFLRVGNSFDQTLTIAGLFTIQTGIPSVARMSISGTGLINLIGDVEHRDGVNPKTFRVYNTYTSSTSFENLQTSWVSNEARIGTSVGSAGGTQRNLVLGAWNSAGTWTAGPSINPAGAFVIPNSSSTSSFLIRSAAYATTGININASGAILISGSGAGLDCTIAGNVIVHNALQIGPSGGFTEFHQAGSPSGTQTGVIEQRYTTCPQSYRIFATRTSSTNFERFNLSWGTSGSTFILGTEKGSGGGSAKPMEFQTDGTTRLTISDAGLFTIADALNIAVGTTTGTKIGTATTQKIGFYNATPVDQPDTVTDATTQDLTGSDTLDKTKVEADLTSCKTAINAIIDRLQELGLIA